MKWKKNTLLLSLIQYNAYFGETISILSIYNLYFSYSVLLHNQWNVTRCTICPKICRHLEIMGLAISDISVRTNVNFPQTVAAMLEASSL